MYFLADKVLMSVVQFVIFCETQAVLVSSVEAFLSFDLIELIMKNKFSQTLVDKKIESME